MKRFTRYDIKWGYIFAGPAIVFFLVFMVYPTINAFVLSLFQYDLLTPPKYVGLENYSRLFGHKPFRQSLIVTLVYVVGTVVPIVVISLVFALALSGEMTGRGFYRTMFFLPYVMSWVAVAIIFTGVFNPRGLVNGVLAGLGIDSPPFWLSSSPFALIALIAVRVWRAFGYYMVIFMAGLQNISPVYYDQAAIDGVNGWQRFWHITWPLLSPTTLIVGLMCVTYGFQAFAIPQIMTTGGPAGTTKILPLLLYDMGFKFFRMGQASTISVVIFVLIAVFALIQARLTRDISIQ